MYICRLLNDTTFYLYEQNSFSQWRKMVQCILSFILSVYFVWMWYGWSVYVYMFSYNIYICIEENIFLKKSVSVGRI